MSPKIENDGNSIENCSIMEMKKLRDPYRWHKLRTPQISTFRLPMDNTKRFLSEILNSMTLSKSQEKNLLKQLAFGLAALHKRGLTHGVLHPGNILVNSETAENPKLCLINPINKEFNLETSSTANDVLSLGILYHQVLQKSNPFHETQNALTLKNVSKGPTNLQFCPKTSVLICQMTAPSERDRILSRDITKNPYFWSSRKSKAFLKFALDSIKSSNIEQKMTFHHAVVLGCKDWRVKAHKKCLRIPGHQTYRLFKNDPIGLLKAILHSIKSSKNPFVWEIWDLVFPNFFQHLYSIIENENSGSQYFYSNPSKINFHSVVGIDINLTSGFSKIKRKHSLILKSFRNRV